MRALELPLKVVFIFGAENVRGDYITLDAPKKNTTSEGKFGIFN